VKLHDIAVAAGLILEKGENRMLIAAILQTHTDTNPLTKTLSDIIPRPYSQLISWHFLVLVCGTLVRQKLRQKRMNTNHRDLGHHTPFKPLLFGKFLDVNFTPLLLVPKLIAGKSYNICVCVLLCVRSKIILEYILGKGAVLVTYRSLARNTYCATLPLLYIPAATKGKAGSRECRS